MIPYKIHVYLSYSIHRCKIIYMLLFYDYCLAVKPNGMQKKF